MMMRKLCLVAALTAAMTGFSAANAAAQLKDGTWTGEGQGRNGAIVVELTAAGGKITAVKVVKHSETPGISDAALARVPGEIVQAQTTGIDTVSGATLTTNGIKAAVAAALKRAAEIRQHLRLPLSRKRQLIKSSRNLLTSWLSVPAAQASLQRLRPRRSARASS